MKKNEINTKELNNLIDVGNKILKLFYLFMIVAIIVIAIFIGDYTNIFSIIVNLISIIMPLFAGFLIAWIFSPLVLSLDKKGMNRTLASVTVILGLVVFLYLAISMLVPVLYHQVQELINVLPDVADKVIAFSDSILETFGNSGINVEEIKNSISSNINNFGSTIATELPAGAMNFLVKFVSTIVNVALSLVLALYILIDFESFKTNLIKLIPKKHQEEASTLIMNVGIESRKCINGILLIASIVALMATVGFSIVGLEAALLMGIICGTTNIIPYIGPWIGGSIAAIIGFTQSVFIGISILVLVFIIQTFESCVLQPIIMGKVTAIHPIIIMVSLLVFGYFFGIIGMIFSTPVLAISKVIFVHYNNKYELFNV